MTEKILYIWYKYIGAIFRVLPIKNNRILLSNFFGKGYGESPKYIAEELLKKNKYELVWLTKGKIYKDIPTEIKQIKRGTLKELYYLATSKIWIDDCRKHSGIKKRKKQFYIQTWHSSLRLKKIEKDAEEYLKESYIKSAKNDSKMIDIITCGCDFSYNTYRNSFWYNGDIIMTGTPKFDIYFHKNNALKNKLLKQLNIEKNQKIVLFAPTFRASDSDFTGNINLKEMAKKLKENNYKLLVKLHPNSNANIENIDNLINVTNYPNIQDLIIICDILITDYSGCCFDALVANKPCILYVPDLKQYLKKERTLYFDYNDLPFKKIYNKKNLYEYLNNFTDELMLNEYDKFSKKIGLKEDGKAAKRIAKIIEGVTNNEKI